MTKLPLSAILVAALLSGAAAPAPTQAQTQPPIVFVHGNGDDATRWLPVIWLFESNGYPANRLFAIRLTDPAARREDNRPEAFRSSTTDQASELAAFVTRVLLETKARKVALVGSSRGGLTIRNYLKNAGGSAVVSHAVLCGTPNHGVVAMDTNLDVEFNGRGHFMRQLNEGSELVAGVRFLTLRSDKLDKFAQPNVGYDGPELKGAENVILPNLDHREVAFSRLAFAQTYRFLTGEAPKVRQPIPEAAPAIGGIVTAVAGLAPTNRPLAGVHFRVFALKTGSADRDGAALLDVTTAETGAWGPLPVRPDREYEFVLEKDGRRVSYFMAGLLRSTTLLNFRFLPATAMRALGGQDVTGPGLLIHRPQGYLAKGRDALTVDGVAVESLLPGIPSRDSVSIQVPEARKAGVRVELRGEVVHARPGEGENDLHVVELIWD
jgi:triacylglycerol lipase